MSEGFTVWLGLVDILNPVIYTLFFISLLKGLRSRETDRRMILIVSVGALLSLAGGYVIAIGKVLVGFNIIQYTLPIPLFYAVDVGFLVVGATLVLIYKKKTYSQLALWIKITVPVVFIAVSVAVCITQGANAGAQLTAAIGSFMIYGSMIATSAREHNRLALILAITPIITTAVLIPYSAIADLNDPVSHWVIEPVNIVGQIALLFSSVALFKRK